MRILFGTVWRTLLLGCAVAANLSNNYLTPYFTSNTGGYGSLLQRTKTGAERPSNQYVALQTSTLRYQGVNGAGHRPGGHSASSAANAVGSRGALNGPFGYKSPAAQIPILRNDYANDGGGNYRFGFETGNGIRRDETGQFQSSWPQGSQNVAGSYSYTGDDGHTYTVNYKADENGFHAEGAHLPTPPPIPPEIQESLALHEVSHSSGINYSGVPRQSAFARNGGRAYAGGYVDAVSVQSPSTRYLPQQRSYKYGQWH